MTHPRILSIALGYRTGFAALEDSLLLDWGVWRRSAKVRRDATGVAYIIAQLMARTRPDVVLLVAEKIGMQGKERGNLLRSLQQTCRVTVVLVPTGDVRRCFAPLTSPLTPNKQRITGLLAEFFPELEPLVPKPRRIWQSEDYWTPMFDALAQAFAWGKQQR